MDTLEQIAAAVLYEGYLLWPYRRSARKNQQRWTFGGVYPPTFAALGASDRSQVQTQVLIRCESDPDVSVELRCLHVVACIA